MTSGSFEERPEHLPKHKGDEKSVPDPLHSDLDLKLPDAALMVFDQLRNRVHLLVNLEELFVDRRESDLDCGLVVGHDAAPSLSIKACTVACAIASWSATTLTSAAP